MAIIQNPQFLPSSSYRPIEWVTQTVAHITIQGVITAATAKVTLDGVLIKTMEGRPFEVLGFGPVFTYGFKWDVESIFQREKAPKAQSLTLAFGTPGVQYNAEATDCKGIISLELEYFYIDATTGLTVSQGFTETTIDVPAFIATRQHEESMSLQAYIPDVGALAPSLWLTTQPTTAGICLQESLFLSTIHGDANFLRVQTFDSSGILIDTGYLVFPASGYNSQVALGVGPNEIRNTTFTSGSVNIDNVLVASYRLTVGQGNAPFVPLSIVYTFNLVGCCSGFGRIHFLNLLGGTDAYTFKSLNVRLIETTSDTAEKPLNWNSATSTPHVITDKGSFSIDNRAVIKRILETTPQTPEFADWLGDLIGQPERYLETPQGFLPITIANISDQELETNNSTALALIRLSVDAKNANEKIIQRN